MNEDFRKMRIAIDEFQRACVEELPYLIVLLVMVTGFLASLFIAARLIG